MAESINLEGIEFVKGSTHRIAARSWDEIQAFRGRYYRQTLDRSPKEVTRFLDATTDETWADPNKSPQRHSRYAKPRAIASYRDGQLTGYVAMANNASSTREGLVGTVEEIAKLRSPINLPGLPLVESRFVAIQEIAGQEANAVFAGMTAHLLGSYRRSQSVTQYLFEDEVLLRGVLEEWGMHADGEPEPVHPYGGIADPEYQTRMLADSAAEMIATIRTDQDAIAVMRTIEQQVSLDSGSGTLPLMHPYM